MSANNGLSADDLRLLRIRLQQQAPPQVRFQPVQDVSQGVAVGLNNITNALLQKQQQERGLALINQMMQEQRLAEAARQQQVLQAYQGLGLTPEQAQAAAMDKELGRQLQKQQVEQQNANTTMAQNQAVWKSNFDGFMALPGMDRNNPQHIALAQLAANNAVYNKSNPLGATQVGETIGEQINLGQLGQIIPDINQLNGASTSPALRTQAGIMGIPITDSVDELKRRSEASLSSTNAEFAPYLKTEELKGAQLSNTGQGIKNESSALELQDQTDFRDFRNTPGLTPAELMQGSFRFLTPQQMLQGFDMVSDNKDLRRLVGGKELTGLMMPEAAQEPTGAAVQQEIQTQPLTLYEQGQSVRQGIRNFPTSLRNFSAQAGGGILDALRNTRTGINDFGAGLFGFQQPMQQPMLLQGQPNRLLGGEGAQLVPMNRNVLGF